MNPQKKKASPLAPVSGPYAIQGRRQGRRGLPVFSMSLLGLVLLGCLWGPLLATKDPAYLDLAHPSAPPCREFLFGTDALGRDIFSMVWAGGRTSLFIGFAATLLSTTIALVLGGASGLGSPRLDGLLMRFTEIMLSVPSLLVVTFIQALLGKPSAISIALAVGAAGWPSMAKVVRTEVRQLRGSGYVEAARCLGGGFFHIVWRHLLPNVFPSIMFMVVTDVRSAILAESTLSFMGLGLPVETVSWGSMLSLAGQALLSGAWWVIFIPGACLAITLLCITEAGSYLHTSRYRSQGNL